MDQLIKAGTNAAMKAAMEYARTNNLRYDMDAMTACLRSWVRIQFQAALHDANEALNANMPKVAEQTFLATMALAGIEAAKEACFPA